MSFGRRYRSTILVCSLIGLVLALYCGKGDGPRDGGQGPAEKEEEPPQGGGQPPSAPGKTSCNWKKFCVDFYVIAWPGANPAAAHDAGVAPFVPTTGPQAGVILQIPVSVPSARFQASSLSELMNPDQPGPNAVAGAAELHGSLDRMIRRINEAYRDCCVWFAKGKVYLVNPVTARVTPANNLVDWSAQGAQGRFFDNRNVGGSSLLRAFEQYVGAQNPGRSCLGMLVADYQPGGNEQGRAQNLGDFSVVNQGAALNPGEKGLTAAHELGHNLGLNDQAPARTGTPPTQTINVMASPIPTQPPIPSPRARRPADCNRITAQLAARAQQRQLVQPTNEAPP